MSDQPKTRNVPASEIARHPHRSLRARDYVVDYPYIRAWGGHMGSSRDYIERQVERARETHAPPDAIYEEWDRESVSPSEKWSTMTELRETNPALHAQLTAQVEGAK